MDATQHDQAFRPTSGETSGWIGVLACVGLAVTLTVLDLDRGALRAAAGALFLAVLIWCYVLRPRIVVAGDGTLSLRNVFSTWTLPLAAVESVAVGALTRVLLTSGRRYDALAVGRPIRPRARRRADAADTDLVADIVVARILAGAEQARRAGLPAGPAVRTWAVPELTALLLLAVAVGLLSL